MWLKIGYQSLFAPPLICSRKTRIAFLWNGGSSQRGLTQRTDLPPYRHPKLAERQRTRHTIISYDEAISMMATASKRPKSTSILAAPCALRRAPRFKLKKRPATSYRVLLRSHLRCCARLRPPPLCPWRVTYMHNIFFETSTYVIFLA
jgi:hypothetical protein